MARFVVVVVAALLLAMGGGGGVAGAPSYDSLCDEIVNAAKEASRAYNEGNAAKAEKFTKIAEDKFTAAQALRPNDPQAYVDLGVFYTNSKRFANAQDKLTHALSLAGKNLQARGQIEVALRRAKYGSLSQQVDEAYDEGRGDVFRARELALQQLSVSPQPQLTHHNLATLELMLSENDPAAMTASALRRLLQAQTASTSHYTSMRAHKYTSKRSMQCLHGKFMSGNWAPHPNVTSTVLAPGLYAMSLDAPAAVVGKDGMVVLHGGSDCYMFSPASDTLLNVGENLLNDVTADLAQDEEPPIFNAESTPVLSLIQFAAASFYHWMCEDLPRLVMAMEHWGTHGVTNVATGTVDSHLPFEVLIPRATPATKFILESIQMLNYQTKGLIEYKQGLHVTDRLRFVSWDRQEGGFSLAHPLALQKTRVALLNSLSESPFFKRRSALGKVLVASRGNLTKQRHFNEDALIMRLKIALPGVEFLTLDGNAPLLENLALFRDAAAVVGAHGGALSNLIVASPGTIVIEIGFRTQAARHYEHLSKALDLNYTLIPVNPDPLGRGMGAPTINVNFDAVATALQERWNARKRAMNEHLPEDVEEKIGEAFRSAKGADAAAQDLPAVPTVDAAEPEVAHDEDEF